MFVPALKKPPPASAPAAPKVAPASAPVPTLPKNLLVFQL